MRDSKRGMPQRSTGIGRPAGLAPMKRQPGPGWPEDSAMREEL
jgi:hypothetical protein